MHPSAMATAGVHEGLGPQNRHPMMYPVKSPKNGIKAAEGVVDQQSSNDSGAKSVKMGHQGISRSSRQDQKQTESKQINRDKGSLNSTRVVMSVRLHRRRFRCRTMAGIGCGHPTPTDVAFDAPPRLLFPSPISPPVTTRWVGSYLGRSLAVCETSFRSHSIRPEISAREFALQLASTNHTSLCWILGS
ncbi:predicted protein [Histoplasma capsulatum H143]|uniref:Uncharacterized protein n=1 Tax=Ajellomyces capsulatus (strain H143) TaxID=544712 RepID=C6HN41_AJECH|nr:predicted protein [Histoplasma capsulatum H143]